MTDPWTICLPAPPSDDEIRRAYIATNSVWKAGELLGMKGQAVHKRVVELGIPTSNPRFTDMERERLLREYNTYADDFRLDELAILMGRSKHFLARQARLLGLTRYGRTKTKGDREKRSKAMKEWHRTHSHPKGFLGGKHSAEAKEKIGAMSRRIASRRTKEEWAKMSLKTLKTRVERYGSIAPPKKHGSWKAGHRKIGQTERYYRSRWEANYARYLEWLRCRGEIATWEHECETFWFEGVKRGVVSYLPDFKVTENNGAVAFHEVKGWMDPRSKTKIARMARYHPSVKLIVIGVKAYAALARQVAPLIEGWES